MTYKIDYLNGDALEWYKQNNEPKYGKIKDYNPSFYISTNCNALPKMEKLLRKKNSVKSIEKEKWRTGWRKKPEKVIKVSTPTLEKLQKLARNLRSRYPEKKYEFFNVDLSRQYRYCLENNVEPVPNEKLTTIKIKIPRKKLSNKILTKIKINEEILNKTEKKNIINLKLKLRQQNPDILVINNSQLIPLLYQKARDLGIKFTLGRMPGMKKLAGKNTYTSYGNVGHSNARYNVYGRVIIDKSNSFFYSKAELDGLIDLVKRSWKPLQELSWGSIGNILTAIQIKKANQEGVLVPWKAWGPEMFKSMKTLHKSDRGGFIFSPRVGIHENVHEVDFSSLYPNIIREHNISPETVRTRCSKNEKVPELGYTICKDKKGYLPQVLSPLIDDRQKIKRRIKEIEDEKEKKILKNRSNALKWILVASFGYQGFSNAKYGRIECHESINAFAREIMLTAKQKFEEEGWKVLHGIIDSIWIQPEKQKKPVKEINKKISEEVGIKLEYENEYEWLAFCPRRNSEAGALTRYFGKKKDGGYKVRGIEMRQKSTPKYIKQKQKKLIKKYDEEKNAKSVLQLLKKQLRDLEREDVDPEKLLIKKAVSKNPEQYKQHNLNWSALTRAKKQSLNINPGENVKYVVINNNKKDKNRVKLYYEDINQYDKQFYKKMLIRAAESILSPLKWDKTKIKNYLNKNKDIELKTFY